MGTAERLAANDEFIFRLLEWMGERGLFEPSDWPDGITIDDVLSILEYHEQELIRQSPPQ